MEIKLQKWGNSNGLRIPSIYLKALNLKANDTVDIVQVDDKIIISLPKKKKISLEEKFKEYYKLTDNKKGDLEKIDWGQPVGREIW